MKLLPSLLLASGLLLSELAHQAAAQATPTKQWDRSFGGANQELLRALHQTSDGGYILGGSSDSGIGDDVTQAGQGRTDYWIVKVDANGIKQWDKRFGGSDFDVLTNIQQTRDGGYILGGYSDSGISSDKTQNSHGRTDFWVIKLDANGTKQWDKTFGGTEFDILSDLQPTSDGGYLLGGNSNSPISGEKTQSGQGRYDYWVVKIDANGTKEWDRSFGGLLEDYLFAMQQTRDGGYILGGYSNSDLSGDRTQPSEGLADYWIVKLDATGTKQWDKAFGGSNSELLRSVQQTSEGGYILGGISSSGISGDKTQPSRGFSDYWLVKLDATGAKQWDKTFGGSSGEDLVNLKQTSEGGYILGGTSSSNMDGDKTQPSRGLADYWIIKVDAVGIKQWDKAFGGSGFDTFKSFQQTSDGGYILGGYSDSGISSDKTQNSHGDTDFWVIKLSTTPLAITVATSSTTLSAYPNPTSSQLALRGPLGTPYQLLNQFGQVVRTGKVSAQPLDVQALPAGLYLLRDQTSGYTTKLVKE